MHTQPYTHTAMHTHSTTNPAASTPSCSQLRCGDAFTALLTTTGLVYTWGAGECGQLGTGRCTNRPLPALVDMTAIGGAAGATAGATAGAGAAGAAGTTKVTPGGGSGGGVGAGAKGWTVTDIACGSAHVLALTSLGSVLAWGLNKRGQLGVGDTNTRHAAAVVAGVDGVSSVVAGGHSSAAVDCAGQVGLVCCTASFLPFLPFLSSLSLLIFYSLCIHCWPIYYLRLD